MTASGYWVQPEQADRKITAELEMEGIDRPLQPGDPLDEGMPVESLRVVLQVGAEHLARLAGARSGDLLTADLINRGLLLYVQKRRDAR